MLKRPQWLKDWSLLKISIIIGIVAGLFPILVYGKEIYSWVAPKEDFLKNEDYIVIGNCISSVYEWPSTYKVASEELKNKFEVYQGFSRIYLQNIRSIDL